MDNIHPWCSMTHPFPFVTTVFKYRERKRYTSCAFLFICTLSACYDSISIFFMSTFRANLRKQAMYLAVGKLSMGLPSGSSRLPSHTGAQSSSPRPCHITVIAPVYQATVQATRRASTFYLFFHGVDIFENRLG